MFKCIGVCAKCGKCNNSAMMKEANTRKTRILMYPDDFTAILNSDGYGVAFDIGTTTVVGMLWDFHSGKQLDSIARSNYQNKYGLDVISRITYSLEAPQNLEVLQTEIMNCINDILKELAEKNGIEAEKISRLCVCGNTTMSHLFLGISTESLSHAPFSPAYRGLVCKEAGFVKGAPLAEISVIPNIDGHVGGDITAGAVAVRMQEKKALTLFIDIGTNGELLLADEKGMLTCSTAAGPAFEGTVLRNGMRAANGAIEKFQIDGGDVFFSTIGGSEPQGICGSGIIDVIAEMLKAGLINKMGHLIDRAKAEEKGVHPDLIERLQTVEGEKAFVIVDRGGSDTIAITQRDISEIQLAKAAIAAGVKLLVEQKEASIEDIQAVLIAGAFGNYIDKKSAQVVGIIPAEIAEEKIISCGNTAGAGASMALMSPLELERMGKLAEDTVHIELASLESFQSVYVKSMKFRVG